MSGYNIINSGQHRMHSIFQQNAPNQVLRNLEVSNLTIDSCYVGGYPKGINQQTATFNCVSNPKGWIAASFGSHPNDEAGIEHVYEGDDILIYPNIGQANDRVVIGNGYGIIQEEGGATIGAHNETLSAWTSLNIMYPISYHPSDETIKENITDANLDICYNNINTLTLKRYKYKDHISYKKEDTNQLGILAQDLQKIFKKSVNEMPALNEEVNGPDAKTLCINTDQLFYCMLGCIQSLQKKNESQQLVIQSLQEKNESQDLIIQSHDSRIDNLENLLNNILNK